MYSPQDFRGLVRHTGLIAHGLRLGSQSFGEDGLRPQPSRRPCWEILSLEKQRPPLAALHPASCRPCAIHPPACWQVSVRPWGRGQSGVLCPEGSHAPPHLQQEAIGWVACAQTDDHLSGMRHNPTSHVNESESNRLQPLHQRIEIVGKHHDPLPRCVGPELARW